MYRKILGENIRKLRLARRIKQSELAEILGVQQMVVSLWENGKRSPSVNKLVEMSLFFERSLDKLVGLDD